MKSKQQFLGPESKEKFRKLIKAIFKMGRYTPGIERLEVDENVALIVVQMLDTLPDREKVALCLRYGLTNSNPRMKLHEIADVVGHVKNPNPRIFSGRASKIIARGMRMMRHPSRIRRLAGLVDDMSVAPALKTAQPLL